MLAIVLFKTTKLQEFKERIAEEMEAVFKTLMYWINGEEFQETIKYFDNAVNEANKTKDQMISLKNILITKLARHSNPKTESPEI